MATKNYLQKYIIPTTPLNWLKVIIGLAFLFQMLLSNQLWHSSVRSYPFVPMVGNSSFFSTFFIQVICFILLIMSSLSLIFFSKSKMSSIAFFCVLGVYFFQDVVSVQAWSYQYFMMILVILIPHFYKKEKKNITFSLQLIVGLTYIWSGIHKVNIMFPELVFSWMMESYNWLKPLSEVIWLGYLVAIFEILLGIGLFFKRFRQLFVWLSVVFHVSIISLLAGHNWNVVVYPWNLAMIAFNFVLFYKKEDNPTIIKWKPFFEEKRKSIITILVVFLFGIAPLLNFFELYDNQLSLKMYSGVSNDCVIYFEDTDLECVKNVVETDVYYNELTQKMELSLDDWAFEELKTPAYAGFWYYKKLAKKVCDCVESENAGILIKKVHRWDWEESQYQISCKEL